MVVAPDFTAAGIPVVFMVTAAISFMVGFLVRVLAFMVTDTRGGIGTMPTILLPITDTMRITAVHTTAITNLNLDSTRAVQAALAWRGFYSGRIDGVLGPETRSAIRSFQAHQGLPVTGQIDSGLINSLRR